MFGLGLADSNAMLRPQYPMSIHRHGAGDCVIIINLTTKTVEE